MFTARRAAGRWTVRHWPTRHGQRRTDESPRGWATGPPRLSASSPSTRTALARPPCVRLRAEVADFKNKMRDAEQSTGKLGQAVKRNEASMRTAGTALAVFGAGATAVATANAKAAIDWESAWAGVTKTVDGTTGQMAALEEGLRGMARELPATHDEIASVAEAAGQLGIETSAVEGFTQTMLDLGETTNLTADQAATALARFGNVMGTSQQDFDRLGSTIVELGNNYATTEAEIVDMSQRLAGAGRQAGLTEGRSDGTCHVTVVCRDRGPGGRYGVQPRDDRDGHGGRERH